MDAIAGFQSAPLWAQIAIVLFAAMVVVAFVEPSVRRRKYRRQFDAIARGLGQATPATRGWPVVFSVSVDGPAIRALLQRHDGLVSALDRTAGAHV